MPVAAVAPGVCDVGEETPISTRGVDELWSEKRFLRAPLATGLDQGKLGTGGPGGPERARRCATART
jgi:hypothetical protein